MKSGVCEPGNVTPRTILHPYKRVKNISEQKGYSPVFDYANERGSRPKNGGGEFMRSLTMPSSMVTHELYEESIVEAEGTMKRIFMVSFL